MLISLSQRSKLIQELLSGMRILKYFSWTAPFALNLHFIRTRELSYIRRLLIVRAANVAVAFTLPVLATILALIVYSAAGNPLQPAIIFTTLSLFSLLRMPLMFLPMSLSLIADARNALNRLALLFLADQLVVSSTVDLSAEYALKIENATFMWDGGLPEEVEVKKGKKMAAKKKASGELKAVAKAETATPGTLTPEELPMQLRNSESFLRRHLLSIGH